MRERVELARRVADLAPALLVGSAAVELLAPGLLPRAPRDVDFLIPLASLSPVVTELDFAWRSWDEPLDLETTQLEGRFYVRGVHSNWPTLDLTYESPLRWPDAWSRRVTIDGVFVACPRDLAALYRHRARGADNKLAERLVSLSRRH
ncbi:MAG: hypothetical protein AAGE52_36225 [Myxococcota bacterium]